MSFIKEACSCTDLANHKVSEAARLQNLNDEPGNGVDLREKERKGV
jgi:hypothetical protein